MAVIGTCGLCGGPVMLPDMWGGLVPPRPKCGLCGAVTKQGHGPVLEMERAASMEALGDKFIEGVKSRVAANRE